MKRKLMMFLFLSFWGIGIMMAQTQVKGLVVDEKGNPIIGATVQVKGANKGGATDANGHFTLSAPSGATLVISYVGYMKKEVPVKANIKVMLEPDTEMLKEVVITAMGVTRDKKALGYATTSIKGDEIAQAKTVNPMNALQGKVAGVDISTAPGPGATQNVIIRGTSSFGNNQPLYIVDGVPITNSQNRMGDNLNSQVDFGSGINALNPDDIANITILKGAAATALYGSRAANGAIMITTKSGKDTEGKIKIVYDGGYTISRVGRLPQEQSRFGQGWSGDRALEENGNWGAPYDGKDRVWGRIVDNEQQVKPYVFLKNRVRDFYDFGQSFKNSLSLSGGTAKTTYFLSLSQNSLNGVIPSDQDSYKRYTISTRGSLQAGKVKVSSSINFSMEKTKAVPSGQGSSLHRSLYEIASDISIVDLKDYNNKFNNVDNYFTPYGLNPYYVLYKDGAVQNKNKLFGKIQLDYDLLTNLKFIYRFGGDLEVSDSETHTAPVKFTPGSPNAGSSAGNAGSYNEIRRERVQLNHDIMANYKINLNENLSLNTIAGLNINERRYNWLLGAINSIDVPGFYNLSNSRSPSVSNQRKELRRLIGVYINADLGYKDYAYLTLTARNDWSSTLPQNNNSYFYPGATFSLLITDLLKSKGINTGMISFAKLRLAYGMTGNDANMYFIYDRYVPASSRNPGYPSIDDLSFPLNGINAYSVSNQLGNPKLKPEITKEFEIGAEARFFNNRIGFDISLYNRFTKGLISLIPKDPSTGYTTQMTNLGDVRNKGIELSVNATPIKAKDFTWDITWNYSVNRNKVESLDVPEVFLSGFGSAGIYAVKGQPLGQFKLTGVKKTMIKDKECIIVDGKGNPQPTAEKEYFGKDIHEKYRMGLTNTLTWKGISVFATLDFRYGGYIYSNTKSYMHWTGSAPESVLNDRQPFIIPNSVVDNGDGTYKENTTPVDPTALHTFYSKGSFYGNQYDVISRSYLKLRDAGIGYQVPNKLCAKLHINGARLSFNFSNILLWTPRENPYIDPETTTFGNDVSAKFGEFNANPSNEFYTFGLTLAF